MFPVFVENSRIPAILSFFSPIEIGAISLGLFVFSREDIGDITRQHESIHYHQWRELGFVLFPLLYGFYYFFNMARGMIGEEAYYAIPFEREAYDHQETEGYLESRRFYAWIDHI
jgi:hypothetical protein